MLKLGEDKVELRDFRCLRAYLLGASETRIYGAGVLKESVVLACLLFWVICLLYLGMFQIGQRCQRGMGRVFDTFETVFETVGVHTVW